MLNVEYRRKKNRTLFFLIPYLYLPAPIISVDSFEQICSSNCSVAYQFPNKSDCTAVSNPQKTEK